MDTLNRKYLTQAIDGSLKRMQLDFIDLVFCHRPDPNTPIEETVWAMSDMITQRQGALLGHERVERRPTSAPPGTIADKHHLHKPVMEQPQYNLFHRKRVEQEYAPLYDDIGLGLTTWSPLASGLLTGKYRHGMPAGSRGALESMAWLAERPDRRGEERRGRRARGRSPPRSARASPSWRSPGRRKNPHVSTVITGASNVGQLQRQPARGRRRAAAHAGGRGAHRRGRRCRSRPEPAISRSGAALSAASCSGVPTFSQRPR